jgi:hypothetical protein
MRRPLGMVRRVLDAVDYRSFERLIGFGQFLYALISRVFDF